jgi:hypothetical protein
MMRDDEIQSVGEWECSLHEPRICMTFVCCKLDGFQQGVCVCVMSQCDLAIYINYKVSC